jgi:hypothetical protein
MGSINGRFIIQGSGRIKQNPASKTTNAKRAGRVSQAVEHLLRK